MNIAGSRRKVDKEIIEFAPMRILDKLFDGIACHTSAPNDSLRRVDKETDRQHFDPILLDGFDKRASVFLHRIGPRIFAVEHFRLRRTMNIRIQQTDPITALCQRYSQVGSYCGFAYSTLAAMNSNDVLCTDM